MKRKKKTKTMLRRVLKRMSKRCKNSVSEHATNYEAKPKKRKSGRTINCAI